MRNTSIHGTSVEKGAVRAVQQRLPRRWRAEIQPDSGQDRLLVLTAPDGRCGKLRLALRRRLGPREVMELLRRADGPERGLLVVAPFLSPRSRDLLVAAGASFVDATGNLRISLPDPAVFLEGHGEVRDPSRPPRTLRSLKGPAAGRVVRALCDFTPPYGVRQLAEISVTPLGTVSRVVSFLEEEALLTRNDKKQVIFVDWPALLNRWVRDYSVLRSNLVCSYLEPRGLIALAPKMAGLGRYAVTGSMAGPGISPVRLAMIYVDDTEEAARVLDLTPTEAGANVWLLQPFDDVVFHRLQTIPRRPEMKKGVVVAAAPSQVAADLLTSPGRGPQEAAVLIKKMKETERVWRCAPRP